jgi:anti-sigma-K factor RskA
MNYQNPELRKRLADEYVLGTLHGRARQRFERLMRDDFSLRELVNASAAQWNSLVESVPPIDPPKSVWQRVENITHHDKNTRDAPSKWFDWNVVLRSWAALATVACLFLGVHYFQLKPELTVSNQYFIVITDDAQSQASWMIGANQQNQTMSVKALYPQEIPQNKVFELWIKIKGESKVRSVGLIPASGKAVLSIDEVINALLVDAELFGVSVEPLGGSPTGQPTTTPLYHGKILEL